MHTIKCQNKSWLQRFLEWGNGILLYMYVFETVEMNKINYLFK